MMLNSGSTSYINVKKEQYKQLLTQKKRLRGLRDLWFFDRYILNYDDMTDESEFHGELCHLVENPKNEKLLILEPRGSLKTSCITIGYTLQQVVKDPNIRVLIASEEFNTSMKFLSEIKGHIEHNEEFKKLYGYLKSRKKWSEKEITINKRTKWRKEPTITCAGIDVTKVGLHYDLIVIDDPHSSKNITTREQIEKVKTWYKLVLSLLDPGGKIIIIGTRWHYDDLFGWIIEKERERKEKGYKRRYRVKIEKAIKEDGTLLWPERLSREFLTDQKLEQGPYIFSCQYQNEPVDDDSAIFKKSWIQFYDPLTMDFEELYPQLRVFTTVDPMRDEEGNDFVGIVTCGMAPDYRAYILDVRRKKMDEYDTIEEIFDVYKKWHPERIGVESVAWQKSYYRYVKAEMLRMGMRLPMCELKTDTKITKRMRIRSMIPYWKSGLFLVPGHSLATLEGNMATLMDELLRYPRVSNDDCIDALAYMDQLMKRPMISKIMRKLHPRSLNAIRAKVKARNDRTKLGIFNVR
jgi:predicted phage terminase large subunit-like protein